MRMIDIVKANKEAGFFFFAANSMEFWATHLIETNFESDRYVYFITSDVINPDGFSKSTKEIKTPCKIDGKGIPAEEVSFFTEVEALRKAKEFAARNE